MVATIITVIIAFKFIILGLVLDIAVKLNSEVSIIILLPLMILNIAPIARTTVIGVVTAIISITWAIVLLVANMLAVCSVLPLLPWEYIYTLAAFEGCLHETVCQTFFWKLGLY